MVNKLLFGLVGVFLLLIVGIGVVSASNDPTFITTISHKLFGDSISQSTATESADAVLSADADSAISKTKIKMHEEDDGREYEVEIEYEEDEDEDTDEDGDDKGTSTSGNSSPSAPTPSVSGAGTHGIAPILSPVFTMAQVATHNTNADCYTAINGAVYNLTSFLPRHPGGLAAISQLCGIDGTKLFMEQHAGDSRPEDRLLKLKIGTLAPQ